MLTKFWSETVRKEPLWSHGTECERNMKAGLTKCELLYTSAALRFMVFYVHSTLSLAMTDLAKLNHVALILYFKAFRYTCSVPS